MLKFVEGIKVEHSGGDDFQWVQAESDVSPVRAILIVSSKVQTSPDPAAKYDARIPGE